MEGTKRFLAFPANFRVGSFFSSLFYFTSTKCLAVVENIALNIFVALVSSSLREDFFFTPPS